jgi:hypothetical protein
MASVRLTNLTSRNYSFEATVLSLQGQHLTVRKTIPLGSFTDLVLPAGVTFEMLATVPVVKNELAKASPSYSIAPLADEKAPIFGGGDKLTLASLGAAASVALTTVGVAAKPGKLARIRVSWRGALVLGESIDIDDLKVGGVSVVIPAPLLVTGPLAAYGHFDIDVDKVVGPVAVPDGALVEVGYTYAGGPGATDVTVDLLLVLQDSRVHP